MLDLQFSNAESIGALEKVRGVAEDQAEEEAEVEGHEGEDQAGGEGGAATERGGGRRE